MSRVIPVHMSERVLTDERKKPVKALAEAIWNSLDAGADHVDVSFEYTALNAISTVVITDDGEGITPERAEAGFAEYGDSWKRHLDARTYNDRHVHGRRGRGRYHILDLGLGAIWTSVAQHVSGGTMRTELSLGTTDPKSFKVSDLGEGTGATGTVLRVTNVSADVDKALNRDDLAEQLASEFALYIRQYPEVEIKVAGTVIDPSSLHEEPVLLEVAVEEIEPVAKVQFIEWHKKMEADRQFYLCDSHGAALVDIPSEIRAAEFHFTAYVCWDGFTQPPSSAHLALIGGGTGALVLDAAREVVTAHLAERAQERSAETLEEWKRDQSYPFAGEPRTKSEEVVRKSFDIVAVSAAPVLSEMGRNQRRFSMELMKVVVETDPSAIKRVMKEFLRLPEERVEELADLFDRTTLEKIITASHGIINRLDFLEGLKTLVFNADAKRQTRERTQLHKMLEVESWLFGDEWTLTASDQTLRRVLHKHLRLLGEHVSYENSMPASQQAGKVLIPDLVLSGSASSYSKSREYLVIELKRPSVTLGKVELDQIEGYARAITKDEQFTQTDVTWDFWLIGNDYDEYIKDKLESPGNPHGCALVARTYRIHVRSWAEIIREAEHRLRYVQQALDASSDEDHGVAYLNQVHADLLPPSVKSK
jgi:Histidine kinase-, DNA gyrase B-, and HSP90-like ATPase